MNAGDGGQVNQSMTESASDARQPWEKEWDNASASILQRLAPTSSAASPLTKEHDARMLQLHKLSVLALASIDHRQELIDRFKFDPSTLPTGSDRDEIARRIAEVKEIGETVAQLREKNALTQEARLLKQLKQAGERIGWIDNNPNEEQGPDNGTDQDRKKFLALLRDLTTLVESKIDKLGVEEERAKKQRQEYEERQKQQKAQKDPEWNNLAQDLVGWDLNEIEQRQLSQAEQKIQSVDLWLQEPNRQAALATFDNDELRDSQSDTQEVGSDPLDATMIAASDVVEGLNHFLENALQDTTELEEYTKYADQSLPLIQNISGYARARDRGLQRAHGQIKAALEMVKTRLTQKRDELLQQGAESLGEPGTQEEWRQQKTEEAYKHANQELANASQTPGSVSLDQVALEFLQRQRPSLDDWAQGQDSSLDLMAKQWDKVMQPMYDKSLDHLKGILEKQIASLPQAPALANTAGRLRSGYEQLQSNFKELDDLPQSDRFTALSGLWTEFSHLQEARLGKSLPIGSHKRNLSENSIQVGVPASKRSETVSTATPIIEGKTSAPHDLSESDMQLINSRGASGYTLLADDAEFSIPVKTDGSAVAFGVTQDKERILVEIAKTAKDASEKHIHIVPAKRLERCFPALRDRISRIGKVTLTGGITLLTEKEIEKRSKEKELNPPVKKR